MAVLKSVIQMQLQNANAKAKANPSLHPLDPQSPSAVVPQPPLHTPQWLLLPEFVLPRRTIRDSPAPSRDGRQGELFASLPSSWSGLEIRSLDAGRTVLSSTVLHLHAETPVGTS